MIRSTIGYHRPTALGVSRGGGPRNRVYAIAAAVVLSVASAAACAQPAESASGMASVAGTPQTLYSLIANAKPGDVITLAAGAYGALEIRGKHFGAPGLTLRPVAGAAVHFSEISIRQSDGVRISGVSVDVDGAQYGVSVLSGSSDVSLSRLKIRSVAGQSVSAMMVRDSREITVADCEISDLGFGINMLDSENVKILRNSFSNLQVDAIRGAASNVEIVGNRGSNFRPQDGDHPDFIQLWGTQSGPGRGNVIRENVYERGEGGVAQGIFIENNEDLTITGNALLGTMYNAISLAGVNRAVVEGNFVQGYKDMGVRIITRGPSADVVVRNNVAQSIMTYDDDGIPNPRYKAERNKSIGPAKIGDTSALSAWLEQRTRQ